MAIRREKVILSLQDDFSAPTLKAAAAAEILDHRLSGLDRTTVSTTRNIRGLNDRRDGIPTLEQTARPAGREIDRLSGRIRLLASLGAAVGPAFIPISAVAIPAVTGLASALGFAALATGGVVVAFQGMGDALEAVNKAKLEPTQENLDAAREAMARLSPEARSMVRELSDLVPVLEEIRDASAEGLFPGVERGLDSLVLLAPRAESLLRTVSDAAGDFFAQSAESLTTDRWTEFFDFLEGEARPVMRDTIRIAGDLTHGLAEMWMAFEPANRDALGWLRGATDDFDRWATELDQTEGFQNFLLFLDENGPQVADTLGAISGALVQVTQAAAPIGGPALKGIEAMADAVSIIADSPFGPILIAGAAGMSALNLASRSFSPLVDRGRVSVKGLTTDLATMGRVGSGAWLQNKAGVDAYNAASDRMYTRAGRLAKAGAGLGGLAFATSGVADELGVANTALLATAGSMAGPWGAAIGGGIGLLLDFKASQEASKQQAEELTATLDQQTGAITASTRAWVVDDLAKSGWLDTAAEIGASGEDVVDAILAGSDAVEQFRDNMIEATQGNAIAGQQAQELTGRMSELTTILGSGREETILKARAMGQQAREAEGLATSLGRAAWETDRFANAQRKLEGFLSKRQAWRAYQASIDDARAALKENGKTLDTNTAKGRANEQAIDDMISATLDYAEKLKGTDRQRFMSQARRDIMSAAREMTDNKAQIDAIRRALQQLDGQTARTTVINTTITRQQRQTGVGGPVNPNAYADGGMVRGPGGPRDDRVPAWLSNGEYVVNAGATSRHRALLDRINARRYADGGLVERTHRASHQAAGRGAITVTVPSTGATQLVVSGVLDTPFGPAEIRGIAEAAAREEISAEKEFDHMLKETHR